MIGGLELTSDPFRDPRDPVMGVDVVQPPPHVAASRHGGELERRMANGERFTVSQVEMIDPSAEVMVRRWRRYCPRGARG